MAQTQKAQVLPQRNRAITDGQNVTINLDVVPSETHNISSEITSHPVEVGADVSDAARPNPDQLTLECLITNTPLPPAEVDYSRAQNAWAALKNLRDNGTLVTVFTSLGRYDSMEIESVSATRNSETYNALSFSVTFKKIFLVQNKLTQTKVSTQKNVAAKIDTGSQTPEEDPVDQSHLAAGADGAKGKTGLKAVGGFLSGMTGFK